MKHLANCTAREFLIQTVKIKRAVEKWLTDTDILNIRKRLPDLPEDMPVKDKRALIEKQARENLSAMFDAVAEAHPDETLALMALMCFEEPEDVDKHTMPEYLEALGEMMGNEAVIGFFTSFRRLARTGILKV